MPFAARGAVARRSRNAAADAGRGAGVAAKAGVAAAVAPTGRQAWGGRPPCRARRRWETRALRLFECHHGQPTPASARRWVAGSAASGAAAAAALAAASVAAWRRRLWRRRRDGRAAEVRHLWRRSSARPPTPRLRWASAPEAEAAEERGGGTAGGGGAAPAGSVSRAGWAAAAFPAGRPAAAAATAARRIAPSAPPPPACRGDQAGVRRSDEAHRADAQVVARADAVLGA